MSNSSNERPVSPVEHGPRASAGDGEPSSKLESTTSTAPQEEASGQQLPLDVVFGILKNRRRRLVLQYLEEESSTSTLSELAEYVAAIENDKPVESLSSSERKRVYVGLYQGHLPRLHEAGVVEFDDDRGTVATAENAEQLTRHLQLEETARGHSSRYYAALALGGGSLFVLQRVFYPSGLLSVLIIGVLLGAVVNLALRHRSRRDRDSPTVDGS